MLVPVRAIYAPPPLPPPGLTHSLSHTRTQTVTDEAGFAQLEECGVTARHFAARDVICFNMTFLSAKVPSDRGAVAAGAGAGCVLADGQPEEEEAL